MEKNIYLEMSAQKVGLPGELEVYIKYLHMQIEHVKLFYADKQKKG